ncbi:MAG: hypothetical protein Q4F01_09450 [Staphylococcus rostri]|uniref:hypothetical protein n=1 Tax=Staphylococcus rostri TaxID=522262 RepID=UPI0026E00F66|nr:hypothetical protein [Staphylococcus rostri]MDO5376389.1 hypothetical protein [Staphylococcus rostri]
MENNLKGIFSYKIKIKSLDDSNNLQIKRFIESLDGNKVTITDFLQKIEGAEILIPKDPIFCFTTDSGDHLLVTDMNDNILDIFILWFSSRSPHTIIKSSPKDLYKKLKSNKKNGDFKFVNIKFELFSERKLDLYPTYMTKSSNEIDIKNKYDFLQVKKENYEYLSDKAFIARGFLLISLLFLLFIFYMFKLPENYIFLLIGIFIPEFINIIIHSITSYQKDNIFLDIPTLRIIEKPTDIFNTDLVSENLDQVTDPE